MTLNDLERQNKEFYGFFGDFGLRHKFIGLSFTRWRHVQNYRYAIQIENLVFVYQLIA